jgi:hypothetical protein
MARKWIVLAALAMAATLSNAEVKYGFDLVTRYVWRGLQFGNSFTVQPTVSVTFYNITIGDWASYPIGSDDAIFDENDRWLSYSLETPAGTFAPTISDYYYPNAGKKFFNFDNDGAGAHIFEGALGYTGPEALPLAVTFAYNFYNDVDKSWYAEIGYPFAVGDASISTFIGAAGGKSAWYGVVNENPQVISIGVTVSKTLSLGDVVSFKLPLSVSFVVNPNLEKAYVVGKIGF